MILRNILEDYWRDIHRKAGYEEIKTPIMLNRDLWERSGHWAKYRETCTPPRLTKRTLPSSHELPRRDAGV